MPKVQAIAVGPTKLRAGVYGNCQSEALRLVLRDHAPFSERFEILNIAPVHQMTAVQRQELIDLAPSLDLLITQSIGDAYAPATSSAVLASLRPTAQRIVIPGAWFNAYFPDVIYPREPNGAPLRGAPTDYHSYIVHRAFLQDAKKSEALRRLQLEIDPAIVTENLSRNMAETRMREEGADVVLSDFIEERFRSEKLFHVVNHPSAPLIFHLADRVLDLLGLPITTQEARSKRAGLLDVIQWPIPPSIGKAIGATFAMPTSYRFAGADHSAAEFVDLYYAFYETRPDLLEHFRERYKITERF
jgi:hypothetical protein